MICQMCGVEVEKRGRNQKYCPTCARISAKARMKVWRTTHPPYEPKPRYCPTCGALLGAYRHYCDKCLAEHERTYQREYKRRIRAKK